MTRSKPARPHSSRNGATRTARVGAERAELADHPVVRAWQSLGGARPRDVHVLKRSRRRKRGAIYRLDGVGLGGSSVIAKACKRKTAEIEALVYGEVLPQLPLPGLRCYGKAQDHQDELVWLFLEDAGAERYSPAEPDHRRLAARWLATVHLHAPEILKAASLPDRGPSHYLVHLMNAREEIAGQLRRQEAESDDALVLEDLLFKLDELESRWGEVAAFCNTLPQTLVHGDLVPKNLRIKRQARGIGLAVFDWEMAGVGIQAPDLAQLLEPERSEVARVLRSTRFDRFSANPCLDTYCSVTAASATDLGTETVEQSAAVGNLFRCLAGIDWACAQATATFSPVDEFRIYSEWLGNAMQMAGWTSC